MIAKYRIADGIVNCMVPSGSVVQTWPGESTVEIGCEIPSGRADHWKIVSGALVEITEQEKKEKQKAAKDQRKALKQGLLQKLNITEDDFKVLAEAVRWIDT